ncbi:MAG TPA: peptidoglycan-binding domain-containing protein [Motilibacterales bacterium]|nr:peptidoglycan-binding domain-containing protein [Motilibacterales bacterium]
MPTRRFLAAFLGAVLVVGLPALGGASPVRAVENPDPAAVSAEPVVPATPADPTIVPADPATAAVPAAPLVLGARALRLGDVGEDVAALQELLKVEQTATFDAVTRKAVTKVQRAAGMKANGVVTAEALMRITKQLKKQAAEARASKKASRGALPRAGAPAASKRYAAAYISGTYGWGSGQMSCLSALWTRESGWRHWASNPNGRYHGIPQTSSRVWGSMGYSTSAYMNSPSIQIKVGAKYIKGRYGSPCNAWSFWRSHHWY